jgi:anti-sigma B factor antagonist
MLRGPPSAHEPHFLTPDFGIESVRGDGIVVVAVSGEVDLCTAPQLAEELRRAQQAGIDVIVDLEQVEFMDCAGLRVLLRFASSRIAASAPFTVTPGTPQVQRLFHLSRIGSLLRVTSRAERSGAERFSASAHPQVTEADAGRRRTAERLRPAASVRPSARPARAG